MNKQLAFTFLVLLFIYLRVDAQIVGDDAYIIGNFVEIGISGDGGFEGADTWTNPQPAGSHFRSNTDFFGFVANPQQDGWTDYDGDFFTPGDPENGWGVELGSASGLKLNNNRSFDNDIFGSITKWEYINGCFSVDWEGDFVNSEYDLHFLVNYQLQEDELFYTTTVTITNNGDNEIPELYYYRNVDPDNNVTLSGDYTTTNTVVNQPSASCSKALVTATQNNPWDSFMGFAGIGEGFRVCHGGFNNRDASDLWNGTGFNNAEGSSSFDDAAISISYKHLNIQPKESILFNYVVILDASQADNAIEKLFYLNYLGSATGPPTSCSPSVDTIIYCSGLPIEIEIKGTAVDDFDWTWSPSVGLDTDVGPAVIMTPSVTTLYTATGTPKESCFTTSIQKEMYVESKMGPNIGVEPIITCNDFDLVNISYLDTNSIVGTTIDFYYEPPVNIDDDSDLFTETQINLLDSIYLVIFDESTGCFDYELIDVSAAPFSIDLGPDQEFCDPKSIGLSHEGTYLWYKIGESQEFISDEDSVLISETGTYKLEVNYDYCYAEDEIDIIVYPEEKFFAPNVFTPNGDNKNETFTISGVPIDEYELIIYNRWGKLIYQSNDINQPWDGKVDGKEASEGTYYYVVKYHNFCETPSIQEKSGNFQLFR